METIAIWWTQRLVEFCTDTNSLSNTCACHLVTCSYFGSRRQPEGSVTGCFVGAPGKQLWARRGDHRHAAASDRRGSTWRSFACGKGGHSVGAGQRARGGQQARSRLRSVVGDSEDAEETRRVDDAIMQVPLDDVRRMLMDDSDDG